jgi:rhodanese-related sulfurtransferase
MKALDAPALARWLADPQRPAPRLIDVREPWEVAVCRIDGSEAIPLRALPEALARLGPGDGSRPVVCICHHGGRSARAAAFLARQGIDAYNLTGGVDAWSRLVDPALPKY